MQNTNLWQPSKFVYRRGKLVASRDPKQVGVSSRLVADAVARLYDLHAREHCRGMLLDLGCGKVPFYHAYKDLVANNICVDWPATMHGIKFLDCGCDISRPLPFADQQFDTVILSDVLEHIPEPVNLCCEISRVLRKGGKCLINVPFYYWLHEEPHDYYRYTEYALRRFADRAGFKILVLESIGGAPEIIADLLAKNVVAVPLVGRACASMIQRATQFLVYTRVGRYLSQRTKKKFPLGYFMIVEKRSPDR
jgi:SAM-dependent methyltransferase